MTTACELSSGFVVLVILPLPAHLYLGAQNIGIDQSSSWEQPKVHLH